MAKIDITKLDTTQQTALVDNRWLSSNELWDKIKKIYEANTAVYENRADWLQFIPYVRQKYRVQANRIFVNTESVINSLIANPPGLNMLPARPGMDAQDFARKLESYFRKKYNDLNLKEIIRKGLRNLYFSRLVVIKVFWNPTINDFDYRAIDSRNVRIGKYATKEQDTEFVIEEIEDNLCAVIDRFPDKSKDLMEKYGFTDENELYIKNPDVKYKEAWINDEVIFKLDNIILDVIKNPYWDWEGILVTDQEEQQLSSQEEGALEGDQRRQLIQQIKLQQDQRKSEFAQQSAAPSESDAPSDAALAPVTDGQEQPQAQSPVANAPESNPNQQANPAIPPASSEQAPVQYKQYFFNYFESPRKPYIFATVFNNENTPIGRTDMITLASELQRGIDKRKMDIDENCELANGVLKVDASVMGKADAQRIRFETKGVIWGKGVKDGVTRETGTNLPQMVFEDMQDSRSEIDNIMAASSAFRGERQGQETKAGRLALVQQSYLRLNELVQVVDYLHKEIFDWGMQMIKTRYTEYHNAEIVNKEGDREVIELIQDDIEVGNKVTIIAGKSLPVDNEWKFEQAQNDVKEGYISPVDYLQIAQYDNAKEMSKNAVMYHMSPISAVGLTQEEIQKIPPPLPQTSLKESIGFDDLPAAAKVQVLGRIGIQVTEQQIIAEGNPSPVSIAFKDLPPDGQVQAAAKAGITLSPEIVVGEKMKEHADAQAQNEAKIEAMKAKTEQPLAPNTP